MSTIDHQPARPVVDDWDWQLSAVCRGMDVAALYHPAGERLHETTARINRAKQICKRCPVINQCAAWGLTTREPYRGLGRPVRSRTRRHPRCSKPEVPGPRAPGNRLSPHVSGGTTRSSVSALPH